jgi:hypothetical protein
MINVNLIVEYICVFRNDQKIEPRIYTIISQQFQAVLYKNWSPYGLVVMIAAFQAAERGSIPLVDNQSINTRLIMEQLINFFCLVDHLMCNRSVMSFNVSYGGRAADVHYFT